MNSVEVKNLDFSYSQKEILKNINLLIEKGAFVTITGPNGSGKSTLLKNLAKILKPKRGEVILDDINIQSLRQKELARKVAVVPQNINIDFPFSVWETVLMGRSPFLKRFAREDEKDFAIAHWAMQITNTLHLKKRAVNMLSGGELQRVILARALTQQPQVLLLDEPTSHLDLQHQLEVLELLKKLNETNNLTIIAVLHDLNLVAQFSTYVYLLEKGIIFDYGTPQEVLTAANIGRVYNMDVAIADNPLTGKFNIIPLGKSSHISSVRKKLTIHLMCGGGTGTYVMDKLVQLGYRVSCGVLNIGDSDWTKAVKLNLSIAEEAPFSPISSEAREKNRLLILNSNGVILTPFPYGEGNLKNLELALEVCQKGKPVLVIRNKEKDMDYTNGRADILLNRLKECGAIFSYDLQDVFTFVEKIRSI